MKRISYKKRVVAFYREVLPKTSHFLRNSSLLEESLKLKPRCEYCKRDKKYYLFDDWSNPIFPNGHRTSSTAWKEWWKKLCNAKKIGGMT